CIFGINVVYYQLMVPQYYISDCVDSYVIDNRSMEFIPFYKKLEIGTTPDYPCSLIADEVKILCEAYIDYVDNVSNYYHGLLKAISDVGNNFMGMVLDLTPNPDTKDAKSGLDIDGILDIVEALLHIPEGPGQTAIEGFKSYRNDPSERSSLLLPLDYSTFASIFANFTDSITNPFIDALKKTDSMVDEKYSLL
ncbi:266_t:CDS:2, partial [Racocetra persica]